MKYQLTEFMKYVYCTLANPVERTVKEYSDRSLTVL